MQFTMFTVALTHSLLIWNGRTISMAITDWFNIHYFQSFHLLRIVLNFKIMSGRLFILTILASVNFSCQTTLEMDTSLEKPILVANSLFEPDSTWDVSLTWSRSFFDNSGPYNYFETFPDADVTILDENNEFVEMLKLNRNKVYHYTGNTTPLIGRLYTIQVKVNNEINLEATSHIPRGVPIQAVEVDSSHFDLEKHIEVAIIFNDPIQEVNYYQVKILKRINSGQGDEAIYFSPLDPSLQNEFSRGNSLVLSDKQFDGKEYKLQLRVGGSGNSVASPVRVVLETISQEYYKYVYSKNLQNNAKGDPFAQPTQIFSNVENGLGIFAGYSSSVVVLK